MMIYLRHTPLSNILSHAHGCLTINDRERVGHYRHGILSRFCQINHLPMPIYDKNDYGKPFAKNIPILSFNQSHCASDYVLIYSLDVKNIGVDIENTNRQVKFHNLAKRYFHNDEYKIWQNDYYDECLWFKLWTIKEAVLKASGIGIRLPLNEIRAVFIDGDTGYVYHKDIGKFYFKNIMINACMTTVAYPFEYGDVQIKL
ncbi:4'-phosphopantetheinyl transferase family protein [Moraxella oblonga]|uniref:4'-phosphopantetheinyl transferase family protein n=1 Tax=Moraxella oblonga TaxID=200413 RepID=UPI0008296074|nr:4'-phosphopantetheinyl transferase superfamily protein [Moraxella oblonga]